MLLIAAAAHAQPPDLSVLEEAITAGTYGDIVSVVVEQHHETIYSQTFQDGHHRRRSSDADPALHDIRSAGKSITALAVGAAIADGHLAGVEVAVWPLLGRTDADHAGIRVVDLLTMSSPLDCDDGQRRSPGNEERMYRRRVWRDFALDIPIDDDALPGRFSYCTAGVFLLGQVIKEATGEPFDAYVQRRIFDPLGITEVVWSRSRSGEVQSGGQLEISAADLTRIGRLVLDGGVWAGEAVVPETWTAEMLTFHRSLSPTMVYGYLWWARPVPSPQGQVGTWYMSGNGGNIVALFSGHDAVITIQSANYNQPGAHEQSFEIVAEILKVMPSLQ